MPDDALGRRDGRGDLRHRERGRVRRENRVRPHDPLELTEELQLRAEILHDRLDDEVAVGEVRELRREREQIERRRALCRAHALLVHLALEEVRDPLVRVRPELARDLAPDSLVAGLDRQLRDPGAHRPEAHDADSSDLRMGHRGAILPLRAQRGCRAISAVEAATASDVVDAGIRPERVHQAGSDDHDRT